MVFLYVLMVLNLLRFLLLVSFPFMPFLLLCYCDCRCCQVKENVKKIGNGLKTRKILGSWTSMMNDIYLEGIQNSTSCEIQK